jgi:predicted DNA-binding transcriptional regulator AlpA
MTETEPNTDKAQTLQERLRALTSGITAPALAGLLGLSRITIYKRASAGDIPCLRIGGIVRFDPVVIAAWLDQKEVAR